MYSSFRRRFDPQCNRALYAAGGAGNSGMVISGWDNGDHSGTWDYIKSYRTCFGT